MNIDETLSIEYLEGQYERWRNNPEDVPRDWQFFFKGFEMGSVEAGVGEGGVCTEDQVMKQARVEALKYRYRDLGHLLSCLDPLSPCPTDHPLLNLKAFGLAIEDLDQMFFTRRFGRDGRASLKDILAVLRQTYCRSVGVEYMHLQDPGERRWLQDRMEPVRNQPVVGKEVKLRILEKLFHAALFETMLNKKYPGQTRFSLEGAEGLIPMLDALVNHGADQGCTDIVMGMAHRGRLNVLVNILQKSYLEVFQEFANSYDPDSVLGSGDVKYHNGYLADIALDANRRMRILLANNPSHLESVDPVVEGIARGLQDMRAVEERKAVMPLLIHGDAAFAGQGVVTETLNLSQLDGYSTHGTVHIIINNQIGYTTLPEHARSTRYSTDVAKMLMVPIFHVHGENPEALVHVARLACDYRNTFAKDVVIDLMCYRRHGHNEGDEPYFTQPEMYQRIRERLPVHQLYAQQLMEEDLVGEAEIKKIEQSTQECLEGQFQADQKTPRKFSQTRFYDFWKDLNGAYSPTAVDTRVARETLVLLSRKLTSLPDSFQVHPKLGRVLQQRQKAVEAGERIDWANAEALAFASLLSEGVFVRLSGQDVGRGTFSHRHSVISDKETGNIHIPLNTIGEDQGRYLVFNSSLSEVGVLGFEYGYSLVRPDGLTLWEAQFGDFVNNAQSVIDLYIASGETKWQRLSGLVLLLPHGWEGLGPEHSSARLERFLQLCAEDNMVVCNVTTPAQYFHLLRRQVKSRWRKPLIVMTPKSLLRNPLAVSNLESLSDDSFQEVLGDDQSPRKVRRVIFVSGKIYYDLWQRREELQAREIAIVRLEQFYPFPEKQLKAVAKTYPGATQWYWVQEEPENMGAYTFVKPRLAGLIGKQLTYVGRRSAASPATGFHNIYRKEQAEIVDQAIGERVTSEEG